MVLKDSEKAKLWRGFEKPFWNRRVWRCGHCSAIVEDPEQHTRWHNDIREILQLIVAAS